jgi:hypothetical protein
MIFSILFLFLICKRKIWFFNFVLLFPSQGHELLLVLLLFCGEKKIISYIRREQAYGS